MKKRICLALGFFDSVHYGHRVILDKLIRTAKELSSVAVVSTFSDDIVSNSSISKQGNLNKLIYTFEERKKVFNSIGLNDVLSFDFNEAFKDISPRNFLQFLFDTFALDSIICGYDYRFGKDAKGDVDFLKEFCYNNAIKLEVVDEVRLLDQRVSSTRIKDLLLQGDIAKANCLLGENTKPDTKKQKYSRYFMTGDVIKGRGVGKGIGYPTANIFPPSYKLLPKHGVYVTITSVQGREYSSLTSIGRKPTFNDNSLGIETYIDGFEGDAYGKEIRITFLEYLREIKHFLHKEELKNQILIDINKAREIRKCYE